MLSQFTQEGNHKTLNDLYNFPKNVYPVGRLDADSEGLLLLTNDTSLNAQLLNPKNHIPKTYYVQVDGEITNIAIEQLTNGVEIKLPSGKIYKTKRCIVELITSPNLPDRSSPIRVRKNIPTSWIKITLTEGKNRQVRKMTAKIGFPTLRIIRVQIGKLNYFQLPILQKENIITLNKSDILK